MKTTLLRGSETVISEIAVAERDARAVAIERIDKHTYKCRIGGDRFLFRSARPDPRAAPSGPGIEFRQTLRDDGATPIHLEELPGIRRVAATGHGSAPRFSPRSNRVCLR